MQIQIEMEETLSLTSLKFWHPPGCCCVTLLTRRQTQGGVKKRRCRHPEIKTQLSFHTQKNDFLSAIRHFNWWVRVLKMVVTAAGWWDEDNKRWSCVWDPALAILTNQDSCRISQDSSGKLGAKDKDWLMSDGKRSSQICEVVTWPGGLTLLKFDNKKISSPLWKWL